MSTPLRVLILEDHPADAELMMHELRRAGFDPTWNRVETEPDFVRALDHLPDIILCDYSIPSFGAIRALRILQDRDIAIPFIVVSGSVGEESAVEIVREGADDYLLKDRLERLGSAVANAIERQRLSRDNKEAEETLKSYAERLQGLREIDVAILRAQSVDELVHSALQRLHGLVPSDNASVFFFDEERDEVVVFSSTAGEGAPTSGVRESLSALSDFEQELLTGFRQGKLFVIDDLATADHAPAAFKAAIDGGIHSLLGAPLILDNDLVGGLTLSAMEPGSFGPEDADTAQEVANQLAIAVSQSRLREAVTRELAERTRAEAELRESGSRLAEAQAIAHLGSWEWDMRNDRTTWSAECWEIFGLPVGSVPPSYEAFLNVVHPDDREEVQRTSDEALADHRQHSGNIRVQRPDGSIRLVHTENTVELDDVEKPIRLIGTVHDVTELRQTEEALGRSMEALRSADQQRRSLLSQLVKAEEDERHRIAGAIHDDSLQTITAVVMRLELLRSELTQPGQVEEVEKLEELVRRSISRLRHLLFELHPRTLDRDGLAPALREFLEQIAVDAGLTYQVENGLSEEPPLSSRRILHRIAREAIANVRKHARASHLSITLAERDGGFLMQVGDDGVGFELSHARGYEPGHLGLPAMRERAEMAGGWFQIDSTPGKGTTVEFWIPRVGSEEGEHI